MNQSPDSNNWQNFRTTGLETVKQTVGTVLDIPKIAFCGIIDLINPKNSNYFKNSVSEFMNNGQKSVEFSLKTIKHGIYGIRDSILKLNILPIKQ